MLLPAFLAGLSAEPESVDELEEELARALDAARAAYPGIPLDPSVFAAFLAERVPDGQAPLAALRQLRVEPLYLACACARGDAAALAAMERGPFRGVGAGLAELGIRDELCEELKQRLRVRLFTAAGDRPPQIARYGGRGDLGRWLRAVALRAGIDELRSGGREVLPGDDALADRALPGDDPALAHMKERYRSDFKAALRQALATLEPEARNDLRLYYLGGLKLEALAGLHRVAPSTISRRLARARQAVFEATRRIMREQLGIDDDDLESILALIQSRLDVSESAFGGHEP